MNSECSNSFHSHGLFNDNLDLAGIHIDREFIEIQRGPDPSLALIARLQGKGPEGSRPHQRRTEFDPFPEKPDSTGGGTVGQIDQGYLQVAGFCMKLILSVSIVNAN